MATPGPLVPLWTVDPSVLLRNLDSLNAFAPNNAVADTPRYANAIARSGILASLLYIVITTQLGDAVNGWVLAFIAALVAIVTIKAMNRLLEEKTRGVGAVVQESSGPLTQRGEYWQNPGPSYPVIPSSAAPAYYLSQPYPQTSPTTSNNFSSPSQESSSVSYSPYPMAKVPHQSPYPTPPSASLSWKDAYANSTSQIHAKPYGADGVIDPFDVRPPPATSPTHLTPAQASLHASAQNPYGNSLEYDTDRPTQVYTGPIAAPPDDTLARMRHGTSFVNPGLLLHTQPDATGTAHMRPRISTAAYGTHHTTAESRYVPGGQWVGR